MPYGASLRFYCRNTRSAFYLCPSNCQILLGSAYGSCWWSLVVCEYPASPEHAVFRLLSAISESIFGQFAFLFVPHQGKECTICEIGVEVICVLFGGEDAHPTTERKVGCVLCVLCKSFLLSSFSQACCCQFQTYSTLSAHFCLNHVALSHVSVAVAGIVFSKY